MSDLEARLRKRYAAERRFRLAGLAAILFSIVVLVFLLITMTVNGIGGFQRATFKVPVDFSAVGLTMPPGSLDRAAGVRALEGQGLPDVVRFSAEQALGEEAAEHLSADAWRRPVRLRLEEQQPSGLLLRERCPGGKGAHLGAGKGDGQHIARGSRPSCLDAPAGRGVI